MGDELVVMAEGCEDSRVSELERQQALEFIVTAACSYVRARAHHVRSRMFFPHQRPRGSADHERVLGCEVMFGAGAAGFTIARDPEFSDAIAAATSGSSLCSDKDAGSRAESLERVERAVVAALSHDGDANLDSLARRLATSPRTLQRRLRDLGTSHRLMSDSVRERMAIDLFYSNDTSLAEIARQLGFSDGVAFHRAFKRWTGMTPGAFRERHRVPGAPASVRASSRTEQPHATPYQKISVEF